MSNELTNIERPTFLSTNEKLGTENISKYLRPSRLKIVQATAGEPFAGQFDQGDCVVVPALQLLAPVATWFRFTPIFFFPQWCVHNPIQLKGQLPFIRESSLDPQSQLALASQNPANRSRPCPENPALSCEVSEHLNVVIIAHREGFESLPILCSFFRGEHNAGSTLLQMIKLRGVSIFGCIFEARTSVRSNTKGRWWGLDFGSPESDPWVKDEEQFNQYKKLYVEYQKAHHDKTIEVDFDDAG